MTQPQREGAGYRALYLHPPTGPSCLVGMLSSDPS